jgi:hypothetical protein
MHNFITSTYLWSILKVNQLVYLSIDLLLTTQTYHDAWANEKVPQGSGILSHLKTNKNTLQYEQFSGEIMYSQPMKHIPFKCIVVFIL